MTPAFIGDMDTNTDMDLSDYVVQRNSGKKKETGKSHAARISVLGRE